MNTTLSPLLAKDPQPSLLLASDARPLAFNSAFQTLFGEDTQALPTNTAALVKACLRQRRAIVEVEAEVGERILLWTFIPDDNGQQVVAAAATPVMNVARRAKPAVPGVCTD